MSGLSRRVALKTKTQLKQKTELPRGEGPKRKSWMSSGGKAQERKTAKKPKSRPRTAPVSVIDRVKGRAKDDVAGLCEIGILCLGRDAATETAHRRGKGSGGVGPKNTTSNTPSNLLRACARCHGRIDNGEVADAERLGLKVRHTVALPSEMPVHLHNLNGWVLLDDRGGYRLAPRAAWDRNGGPLLPVVAAADSSEPGYVDLSSETLKRFGHHRCGGFEWDEEYVVSCVCGAIDLFVAEVRP